VCGSGLWPWRGTDPVTQPTPMGHEYAGIVEEAGPAVRNVRPGQFVVVSVVEPGVVGTKAVSAMDSLFLGSPDH